jgi:hypothetical protein
MMFRGLFSCGVAKFEPGVYPKHDFRHRVIHRVARLLCLHVKIDGLPYGVTLVVPAAPSGKTSMEDYDEAREFPREPNEGDVFIRTDLGRTFEFHDDRWNLRDQQQPVNKEAKRHDAIVEVPTLAFMKWASRVCRGQ